MNISFFKYGVRKKLYENVSDQFSDVRSAELSIVKDFIPDSCEGLKVLEIGSGTGFLTDFLADLGFIIDAIDAEFSKPSMANNFWRFDLKTGLPPDLPTNHYDVIISLASMHHIADINIHTATEAFWCGCQRVLKPEGKLVLIDVAPEKDEFRPSEWICAKTGSFFHNVIDYFCFPSHEGAYLKKMSTEKMLKKNGFIDLIHKDCICPWCFSNEKAMNNFFKEMFNLENLSLEEIGYYLMKYVGYDEEGGALKLHWGLQGFAATKNHE